MSSNEQRAAEVIREAHGSDPHPPRHPTPTLNHIRYQPRHPRRTPVTFHVKKDCWEIGGRYQATLKQHDRDVDEAMGLLDNLLAEDDDV